MFKVTCSPVKQFGKINESFVAFHYVVFPIEKNVLMVNSVVIEAISTVVSH